MTPFSAEIDSLSRRIRVTGELDIATVRQLIETVAILQAVPGAVTLDLRPVTFLDACTLGALVRIAGHQRDAASELFIHGNAQVLRVAQLGGVESIFTN